MTLPELAGEKLGGFKPGEGVAIWVNGVRTVGTAILPGDLEVADAGIIDQILTESVGRLAIGYTSANSIFVGTRTEALGLNFGVTADRLNVQLFNECEMGDARVLTADEAALAGRWLIVKAKVSTFIPGTRVYVIAESDRLIIGQAIVNKDGTASVAGAVPISLLGPGAHRFRIIGSRELANVTADDQGEVILTTEAMESIRTYDNMSTAAVHFDSSTQHLVRYIPLREGAPWWLLLLITAAGLFGIRERKRLSKSAAAPSWRKRLASGAPALPVVMSLIAAAICFATLFFEIILPALAVGAFFAWRVSRTQAASKGYPRRKVTTRRLKSSSRP